MHSIILFVFAAAVPAALAAPNPESGAMLEQNRRQVPLRNFHGCSAKDKRAIRDSFDEANQLLSDNAVKKIDFGSTAALDFFGPSPRNAKYQKDLQEVINRASDAADKWSRDDTPAIYCRKNNDDHPHACEGETHAAIAVANLRSRDRTHSNTTLTFCPWFFSYSTLSKAMKEGKKGKDGDIHDIRSYDTRARHWIQAMTLIDKINGSENITLNSGITDVKMVFPNAAKGEYRCVMTPATAKLLARYAERKDSPPLAIRNAHNIAWFALEAYVYGKLKDTNQVMQPVLSLDADKAIARAALSRDGVTTNANLTPDDTLTIAESDYIVKEYTQAYLNKVDVQSGQKTEDNN